MFSLCQDLHDGNAILEWVGGMYGMNNKYSIEHPLTWKAIQWRQGKIVNTPTSFPQTLRSYESKDIFWKLKIVPKTQNSFSLEAF